MENAELQKIAERIRERRIEYVADSLCKVIHAAREGSELPYDFKRSMFARYFARGITDPALRRTFLNAMDDPKSHYDGLIAKGYSDAEAGGQILALPAFADMGALYPADFDGP